MNRRNLAFPVIYVTLWSFLTGTRLVLVYWTFTAQWAEVFPGSRTQLELAEIFNLLKLHPWGLEGWLSS